MAMILPATDEEHHFTESLAAALHLAAATPDDDGARVRDIAALGHERYAERADGLIEYAATRARELPAAPAPPVPPAPAPEPKPAPKKRTRRLAATKEE